MDELVVDFVDAELRTEDSSEDLRRYQECAKKLDECSKNLLRLCQVSGELNNLHDDDIERAANEIIRTEEEEAKKIAAELLHQKGLLHRNIQEPEVSTTSYLSQEDCAGPRPRSAGAVKSTPSRRGADYEVPKTLKNPQEQCASDQRSNVHQQVINQPPYAIFHCEERVPCQPCPSQPYSSSGMSRPNPCTDYSSSTLREPAMSTPYATKGDGSERKPPYFRQAQQQPPQSTWGRPEPVWNTPVNRKTDSTCVSNPRLLDLCNDQMRKVKEMTQSCAEPTKRGTKPQTIRLTAGAGRAADPPVHIVITAIANDCSSINDGGPQQQSYLRDPVYSDNEFAEESGYSLGNKGPSTIYSSPNGDDRVPQKNIGCQQKLVDRGSDAYVCSDDANRILKCALKCWEKTKNSLRDKCQQQANSIRAPQSHTIYECQEQALYPNHTQCSSFNSTPQNLSTKCDQMQQNPGIAYSQSCTDAPMKTFVCAPGGSSGKQKSVKCAPKDKYKERMCVGNKDMLPGNQGMGRTVLLKCCNVPTEAKSKQVARNCCDVQQSRPPPCYPVESREKLRQCSPPTPCRDRKTQYEQSGLNQTQFGANQPPRGTGHQYKFGGNPPQCGTSHQYQVGGNPTTRVPQQPMCVPKTYQCTQISPPSSNPSAVGCAPTPPMNCTESKSMMKSTASEMDSSILLAIAKAAINLSLEKQQEQCEHEEEYEEDCDSGYPDMLDSIFE